MSSELTLPEERPTAGRLWLALGAALYILFIGVGAGLGGEAGQVALASLNALPFAGLAVLAYLGGRSFNWAWVASGIWLLLLVGGAVVMSLAFTVMALVPMGSAAPPQLAPGATVRIALLGVGLLLSSILGALTLLPPVRRGLARVLPIDPASFVHAMALAAVVSIGLICFIPLAVLGEPPLLAAVDQISAARSEGAGPIRDSNGLLRDQIYSLAWIIPAGFLAVGFGVRRGWRDALQRLGLVRPSLRQILAGIGVALALVAAVQLLGSAIEWIWGALGWPTTDEEAFSELISFAFSPIGAAVIGIVAGLGEELGVRGVLQPRLGILLSNLFFVSLHALQYNWDALLVVFIVGTVCGLVRKYSNTSTAAIVHGVYNFTLIMLAVLVPGLSS